MDAELKNLQIDRSPRRSGDLVLPEGKAVKWAVKTGAASGQSVRVEKGLVEGEDLIVNPPSRLKDGAKERQQS
jgi:hypothetical protein